MYSANSIADNFLAMYSGISLQHSSKTRFVIFRVFCIFLFGRIHAAPSGKFLIAIRFVFGINGRMLLIVADPRCMFGRRHFEQR